MKNPFLILILFSIFLTSCGKNGKLYLPDEPQEQGENGDKNEAK